MLTFSAKCQRGIEKNEKGKKKEIEQGIISVSKVSETRYIFIYLTVVLKT